MNKRPSGNNHKISIQSVRQGQDRDRPRRRRKPGHDDTGSGLAVKSARPEIIPQAQAEHTPGRDPVKLKRYAVIFYETHAQARDDAATLGQKKAEVDQLNIVIRAEGTMEDPELLKYGKLYAGEAWHLIHSRRVDDGWYNEAHE